MWLRSFLINSAYSAMPIKRLAGAGTRQLCVAFIAIWRNVSELFGVVGVIRLQSRGCRELLQRQHSIRGAGR
jgi:hypothetical protein